MKCAVTTCQNEAEPKLVHVYTGKTYCPACARKINQWDSRKEVVPFPKQLEQAQKRLTAE